MSDDPLTECPECKGEMKRLIGGGMGVIFKGTGFYVNDTRKGPSNSRKTENSQKTEKPAKSNSKTAN
jgi:predicted nucleic acid-binding Zn ribbon protein